MTELERLFGIPEPLGDEKQILKSGQKILFCRGVQLRMASALILLIFIAVLPVLLFSMIVGGWVFLLAFECFLAAPTAYGLFVMARKAANGQTVSMRDLFFAFSRYYWHAVSTVFWFALFAGLPLLIPAGLTFGAVKLGEAVGSDPSMTGYAVLTVIFGILLAILSIPAVFLLQMPAYLLPAIRAKDPKGSSFYAADRSFRLLRRSVGPYMKLRMQLLLLDLLSCASVCALFPIYTLPLYFSATAGYLDLLDRKMKAAGSYLTSIHSAL